MRAGRLPCLSLGVDQLERRYVEFNRKHELAGEPAPKQLRGYAPGARQRSFAAGDLGCFAEHSKVCRSDADTPGAVGRHRAGWRPQPGRSVRPPTYGNSRIQRRVTSFGETEGNTRASCEESRPYARARRPARSARYSFSTG